MLREYLEIFRDWLVRTLKSRIFWIGVVCTVFFSVIVVRLYNLQIRDGASYYESFVDKTTRTVYTSAVRGNIYDRNGELLAGNEVVYNVTMQDLGVYNKRDGSYNAMILRLIRLLNRFGVEVDSTCPVIINEHGEYEYSGTDSEIRQFIKDVYGEETIETYAENGVDAYSLDCATVMDRLFRSYNFSTWTDMPEMTDQEKLDICNVRYAMSATSYTRYISTTIATDVSDELSAAVMENANDLQGVEVVESTRRVYPDSVYFSGILGYTGHPNSDELDELQEEDETYSASDYVGKSGLEQYYESTLAGTKGTQVITVNNVGNILETQSETESVNGNDIYLSLDKNLQIACYHLLEQRLAAILAEKLVDGDFEATEDTLAEDFKIPVKDAYFQMINNNILDTSHLLADDATENEKAIGTAFTEYRDLVISHLSEELTGDSPTVRNDAGDELSGYFDFIISLLTDRSRGIMPSSSIDTEDEVYQAWSDGTISLQEYLKHSVDEGWVDSSRLDTESKYADSDTIYSLLTDRILTLLEEDDDFAKLIYEAMIDSEVITGNQICMALIDQGVLDEEDSVYESLKNGDHTTAYQFMLEKITNIEITPAQLALDPCSGSAVVTDEQTGELLAVVSYPGYDLNELSGTVDRDYWEQLTSDLSSPLYNRATQARTAPGSTYKMVTASAGLNEGVITADELINCVGTYDKLDHPMCWIAREQPGGMHGELNTVGALAHSCNFYFYEVGYRLSLNEDGEYDASIGIEKLNEYAQMFGFGEKTGIEISENASELTTEYPVTSAIGQGTNNFTTISLARYVEAVASSGNLYRYQLLKKVADPDGNTVEEYVPEIESHIELSDEIWDILHEGMHQATKGEGSQAQYFTDCEVDVAGKSGSAQENRLRANHGMFVCYAPYDNPEISMAVSIPNGYTAGNAGLVAKEIVRYYFGYLSMEDILANSYESVGSTSNGD